MKKPISILLASILCLSMVSCAQTPPDSPNTSSTPPSGADSVPPSAEQKEPITLKYYDWQLTEEPAGEIVKKLLAAYEAENPHVKIEQQAVPTAERGDKLMIMIMGGESPDVVHINEADLARFVPMNSLEPLDSYLAQDTELQQALIPAMVNMSTYDDIIYGVPRFASINTLIYNAKHFRDAGLDPDKPPATWDEFLDCAKKLTVDTDSDGTTDRWGTGILGAKTTSMSFRYWWALWGAGGEILNEDGSKSELASEASAEAIQFYTDLALKHKVVPPGVTDVDYTALVNDFIAEKTTMICDGPWQISRIKDENPNIEMRAAPMPSKPGITSATTGGGGFLGVCKASEKKEAAWDLVRYLSSAAAHWTYVNEGSFLPCRVDTAEKLKAEGDPLLGQFADTLTYSKLTPSIAQMTQINTLLAEEIQFVLIGEKTPKAAADSLGARVDELIAK